MIDVAFEPDIIGVYLGEMPEHFTRVQLSNVATETGG